MGAEEDKPSVIEDRISRLVSCGGITGQVAGLVTADSGLRRR